MGGHVSYSTDSAAATKLRLCSSLERSMGYVLSIPNLTNVLSLMIMMMMMMMMIMMIILILLLISIINVIIFIIEHYDNEYDNISLQFSYVENSKICQNCLSTHRKYSKIISMMIINRKRFSIPKALMEWMTKAIDVHLILTYFKQHFRNKFNTFKRV